MSLKHAILGFLSFKSLTGYDLKKAFDRSIQHFWPANQSQIYRTLASLKGEGLVTQEVIEREERLDMKRYHITEAGRQELGCWLATPLAPQDYREPFLIQVYFAGKLTEEELAHLLQREIQVTQDRLVILRSMLTLYPEQIKTHPDPRGLFLSLTTLEYGITSNQAALDWLKSVVERVKSQTYTLYEYGE